MRSYYSDLPDKAFWKTGVSNRAPTDPGQIFEPKFPLRKKTRIFTAGSCFAQHVGRTLRRDGFNVLDMEPAPSSMSDKLANRFGYRLFSARFGNIYTVRQLLQLIDEAEGKIQPACPIWERKGRYYDAFRPNVEPKGFETPELVEEHRAHHLEKVLEALKQTDLFIFTFGLTEAWIHTASETVYPTAPGTIAGDYDPEIFSFKNFSFQEIYKDFKILRRTMMEINPKIKFLVTVSPVPLTATATNNHVEVATVYSKSVLRAVCGTISDQYRNVDYFPSYEIITSQNSGGIYFEENMRSVTQEGVNTAMSVFSAAYGEAVSTEKTSDVEITRKARKLKRESRQATKGNEEEMDEVVCEEILLEAFAK